MMGLVRLLAISALTAIMGTIGIFACLIVPGGRLLMPLARLWSRFVLWICRVELETRHPPGETPRSGAIYIANHQSQLDIPALVLAMPVDFRIVAKRSLLRIPIFGWALWLAGFIFIERGDRDRAIRSLDRAARKIRRGTSIVIFPEGTRSPDGTLLPFKKGGFVLALQAGTPIIPVSIHGGHAVLPKGSLNARPGIITVGFDTPIETHSLSLDSRDALIETVRDRILVGLRRISAE